MKRPLIALLAATLSFFCDADAQRAEEFAQFTFRPVETEIGVFPGGIREAAFNKDTAFPAIVGQNAQGMFVW